MRPTFEHLRQERDPEVKIEYRVRLVSVNGERLAGPPSSSCTRAKSLYLRVKSDAILGHIQGVAEVHLERRATRYIPFQGWVPA